MATIEKFEDLEVWQLAREVANEVFNLCQTEPFARDCALKDQICRSAVSVMSNVAEEFERDERKEFINFLSIAKGSAGEVRSRLYVALDRKYVLSDEFEETKAKVVRTSRAISGLVRSLNQSEHKGVKFKQT